VCVHVCAYFKQCTVCTCMQINSVQHAPNIFTWNAKTKRSPCWRRFTDMHQLVHLHVKPTSHCTQRYTVKCVHSTIHNTYQCYTIHISHSIHISHYHYSQQFVWDPRSELIPVTLHATLHLSDTQRTTKFTASLLLEDIDRVSIFHVQLCRCVRLIDRLSIESKSHWSHFDTRSFAVRRHQFSQWRHLLDLEMNDTAVLTCHF